MLFAAHAGPGVWELKAKGAARDTKCKVTTVMKALPTPTHMMLVKLYQVCWR